MKSGFINILKPCGMSSSDAVFRVKRALGIKAVGHMGTLDPAAAGVLPVAVGRAARLFDYLLDKRKVYRTVFYFGIETDTLDSFGKALCSGGRIPDATEIEAVIPAMCGRILQTAPKFSAKKINGRKGYELARAQIEYELPKKEVWIESIRLRRQIGDRRFEFDIVCGGGTYIRSIARDMSAALGTVAVMETLIRTESGVFRIGDALTPEELDLFAVKGGVPFVAPDLAVGHLPRFDVPDGFYEKLGNGVPYCRETAVEIGERAADRICDSTDAESLPADGVCRVYCRGEFFGMGECSAGVMKMKTRVNTD